MPAPARRRSATLARPASESHPILAVALALIGTFLLVAMAFHTAGDNYWGRESIETHLSLPSSTSDVTGSNPCGAFGASIAVLFFSVFGYAAFLIPASLFVAAWFALNHRAHTLWPAKVALMSACLLFGAPLFTLGLDPSEASARLAFGPFDPKGSGGLLGGFLYHSVCKPVLGEIGTWLLVFPYAFCLLGVLADDPKATLAAWIAEMRDAVGAWNAERKAAAAKAVEEQRRKAEALAALRRKQEEIRGVEILPAVAPTKRPEPVAKPAPVPVAEEEEEDEEADDAPTADADEFEPTPATVKAATVTVSPPSSRRPSPWPRRPSPRTRSGPGGATRPTSGGGPKPCASSRC